ncbi:L-seryl-tRNA(Sec) selenium transferase [Oceanirhabdus sp. W0125-5]|uniref:L-seryl-tRNA(Sec) selenium transferase n=1 Tax=Oceanirhabdus sp. W0125-5 TaxID=2999116 RepID=UPI0022F300EC|nr:L-seryl-tRNA(Sec) selenium transferase [Oceanirhabdus sp. W0125-5]WBW95831.1 L-seryl-tRNA(Sec) selenium transferase [Oceanirhabdus sp. W0125-5]
MNRELLRNLPKVDELLDSNEIKKLLEEVMRPIVVESVREAIDQVRSEILSGEREKLGEDEVLSIALKNIKRKNSTNLRRIINATGTVIHTNLGRSLLSKQAMENVINAASNYSNLEYDVEKGKRGSRYSHIEDLIVKITGAEAAMVVNNNAAAVMLVLNTLCKDKEAIVSRGQLVEIGGSFRVPDVMKFSNAKLIEVGTTNRTHDYDYENAINEDTGVLLKVHTSNFKILGFTEEVSIEDMVELGNKYSLPVVEDIGSGVLVDYTKYGFVYEPTVQESIKKGIDVVTFSGDKMLGGPQAGIIAGKKKYIDMMKKNQLTRALRIDKMTLAALEGTLKHYLDESDAIENIPSLNMILMNSEDIKKKAYKLKRKLVKVTDKFDFNVDMDFSMVGGGSMPTERIKSYVIKVKGYEMKPALIEKKLRECETPVVVRVSGDSVIMDLRTIKEDEFNFIVDAFKEIG